MLPILHIGGSAIRVYPALLALAIVLGAGWSLRRLRVFDIPPGELRLKLLAALVACCVGLALPAAIEALLRYLFTGQVTNGLVIRVYYGLALMAATVLVMNPPRSRMPGLAALDRTVAAFAGAFALSRVGCLLAGCCGGVETSAWFGLYLPDEHGIWLKRYPTQIMSGVTQLAMCLGLLWLEGWLKRHSNLPAWTRSAGVITMTYLFVFCLDRFLLDFLRADYMPVLGPLSQPQILMLIGMFASAAWFVWRAFTSRRAVQPRPAV